MPQPYIGNYLLVSVLRFAALPAAADMYIVFRGGYGNQRWLASDHDTLSRTSPAIAELR
jgi:hypothetical protein